jgi:hypothetical protein
MRDSVANDVFRFSCAKLYQIHRLCDRFRNSVILQTAQAGVTCATNTKYVNTFNKFHVK